MSPAMKILIALLLMTTTAMAKEFEIQCVEIESVAGQPFFLSALSLTTMVVSRSSVFKRLSHRW